MLEGLVIMLPALTAVIYSERQAASFFIAAFITLCAGAALRYGIGKSEGGLFEREGFMIVALVWVAVSLFGALPYVMSGDIPSYADAFFETVSGFTTTGASVVVDVEALSHASLLWKGLTHWLGGMGILLFVIMIGSKTSNQSMQIMKAEIPGPVVGKVVPRARDSARALYLIYTGMTLIQIILLMISGMKLFDAVFHSLSTAGTGGFGMRNDSLASYGFASQWIITVFMVLFGVNFNLYYYIVKGEAVLSLRNAELRFYIAIVLISIALVTGNVLPLYDSFADSLRLGSFQVASIISTTGFSTADFDKWPHLSKLVLFIIMFLGGCAGSTAGGLKISRVMILAKGVRAEMSRLLRPRRALALRMEGKPLEASAVRAAGMHFALYISIFIIAVFLITLTENADPETAFSASAACLNNIGPGFSAVGPASNYSGFSALTKLILSFEMLIGRLEIYPILLMFSIRTWREK